MKVLRLTLLSIAMLCCSAAAFSQMSTQGFDGEMPQIASLAAVDFSFVPPTADVFKESEARRMTDSRDACTDGQAQAAADVQKTLWMAGGCLLSFWVIIAAQVIEPSPPATAVVGKSADYTAQYTDCYSSTMKSDRTRAAVIGCLAGGAAIIVFYGLLAVAATAT